MLTDQEIFNKAYRHVIKQGRPATNGMGGCRYQTEDGLSCAIGCMLPPDIDTAPLEGMGMTDIAAEYLLSVESDKYSKCYTAAMGLRKVCESAGLVKPLDDDYDLRVALLIELQNAHDASSDTARYNKGANFIELFKEKMEQVAKDYNLEIPKLED